MPVENSAITIDGDQRREIIQQIGAMNIGAISGGRVIALQDGIELPVSNGYKVRVHLTAGDDYTVERVFVRNGQEFAKGTRERVYCTEIGEVAYRASCFRSYDESEW